MIELGLPVLFLIRSAIDHQNLMTDIGIVVTYIILEDQFQILGNLSFCILTHKWW